jgi:flagellar basal body-associated protein FliL
MPFFVWILLVAFVMAVCAVGAFAYRLGATEVAKEMRKKSEARHVEDMQARVDKLATDYAARNHPLL